MATALGCLLIFTTPAWDWPILALKDIIPAICPTQRSMAWHSLNRPSTHWWPFIGGHYRPHSQPTPAGCAACSILGLFPGSGWTFVEHDLTAQLAQPGHG